MLLEVDQIECRYQQHSVVRDLSFSMGQGEISCLLGPSGCGKTTVLRAIAGFLDVHQGRITLNNSMISSAKGVLPPEKRNIGMVFQDYALFPHLTVKENINFGISRYSSAERRKVGERLLKLVHLTDLADRYPHELSGGQQQRVALARALAPKPKLLLMDEPFSNLDTELRRQLSIEVREILKEENIAAILVTHDQNEAFTVSDSIGVLAEGKLQQWGESYDLYHHPANRMVASFVGEGKFLRGQVVGPNQIQTDIGLVRTPNDNWVAGAEVDVFIRPHEVVPSDNICAVNGEVVKKEFLGTSTLYTLRLPSGHMVESSFITEHDYKIGEHMCLQVETDRLVAFPAY